MLYPNGVPATGHGWLNPLEKFLTFLLADCIGGANFLAVDYATVLPLPANTYNNGASGVGATLTGNSNGALVLPDGSTPILNQLVLVAGEGTPANGGLYQVTTVGTTSTAYVLTRFAGFTAANGGNSMPAFNTQATMVPFTTFGVKSGSLAGKTFTFAGPVNPTVGTSGLQFAQTPKPALFRGAIAASRMVFSVNPTANDTIAIGGTTFKYVAALGAAVAQVQVLIGGNAAASLLNTINAINGDSASKGTTWVEATTPFAVAVRASKPTATTLSIKNAVARGGAPVSGPSASVALTASITGGANTWQLTNLNLSGKQDSDAQEASGAIAVTAAMITFGTIDLELPFVPSIYQFQVLTSTGAQRGIGTDTVTIAANGDGTASLHVVLAGGASPNIQATDTLTFWAQQ